MNVKIKSTNWERDQPALCMIRRIVFIEEQQVDVADEWDDKDETAIHFLVEAQQKAIACARLLIEGDVYHIGRVAVLKEFRHQKIGRQLMQFILDWCHQKNPENKIYLHAQTSRVEFYEYLGFVTKGEVFLDAGIDHIEMWYNP